MKKKTIAVSILSTAVFCAAPVLVGCSGDHYGKIDFDAQDTSYVVTSQGGSAVSYGNYMYFINGTRGYEDTDGKANVWDDVVKGALYRAEFNGQKSDSAYGDGVYTFDAVADDKGLAFKYTEGKDYYEKDINIVDVTKIAPKTVGTTGYAQGGIFIYDNYVYFASPNNSKNSTGTVQTTRTDYFMMPLSGGEPTKIYTSTEGVNTSSSPYAFYKFGGSVYLVVSEDSNIVSVRIDASKAKAEDPVKFEVNATSVYFPVRDVYYNGITTDTVEDFIYFVRSVTDDDTQKAGTVIEAMRPDGSENFKVSENGLTETIDGVRDGVFFYRTTDNAGNTVVAYTSLHDMLTEHSPTYAADQESKPVDKQNRQFGGRFRTNVGSFTATYPFRSDLNSNEVYFIGVNGSTTSVYSVSGTVRALCQAAGTPQFIRGNYLYYAGSSNDFYRVAMWENMEDYGKIQNLASSTTSAGISCDYAAGYFTYFGEVDKWASGYSFFEKVDGVQVIVDGEISFDPVFVGLRSDADIPREEELEEELGTSDSE